MRKIKNLSLLKKILLILAGIAALAVIGCLIFVIVVVYNIVSWSNHCDSVRTAIDNQAQPIFATFQKISVISGQPNPKIIVEKSGDCFDSKPAITATKTYKESTSAGDVLDQVTATLTAQGFSGPKPLDPLYSGDTTIANLNMSPCTNTVVYSRSGLDIQVILVCNTDGAVDMSLWKQFPASELDASVDIEGQL